MDCFFFLHDQISIWRLEGQREIFYTFMTSTIPLYCMIVLDFACQWWALSLSIGGPLCSILHHCKTLVQVAKSVSRAVMVHNRVTDTSPLSKDISVFVLTQRNIFFKSILSNTKGIPSSMQQHHRCSPKTNNVLSYTTPFICILNPAGKHGQCSITAEVAAQISGSCMSLIMQSWSFPGWVIRLVLS